MTIPPAEPTPPLRRWIPWLGALLFALAHTQPLTYYSNQNQYFLHGLADAGMGELGSDWLANTRDPTPLFSGAIALAEPVFGHAGFFALLMVYALSLTSLSRLLPFAPRSLAGEIVLQSLVTLTHSALVRMLSVQTLGIDYPWYLQAGVANQYLIGAGLQPSVFGVLLLTALAAFGHGRPRLAGFLVGLACLAHSTYLLPAALLTLGMMAGSSWRDALALGAIALAVVTPVLAYIAIVFAPTDPQTFAAAQQILAWVRIPHHTDPARWLDLVAGLQTLVALLGLVAWRGTRLARPLTVAAGLSLLLSIVAGLWHQPTLSLLFPWRLSAVLVPLATLVGLTALARGLERFLAPIVLFILAGLIFLMSLIGAYVVMDRGLAYQESQGERGLLVFARDHRAPGQLYLLPAGYPKPPSRRGSASSTFIPVRPSAEPAIFELQRFRLQSGVPAYVDFKSIPYHDRDVLEWQRRLDLVVRWYGIEDWDTAGIPDQLRAEGITHVVIPAGKTIRSTHLQTMFQDPTYRVAQLK